MENSKNLISGKFYISGLLDKGTNFGLVFNGKSLSDYLYKIDLNRLQSILDKLLTVFSE